ncbi:MutS domain I protein [delta proteobacterium NaphS2]|nr:MutS domain I protein [delta proteobacterium NaphS2]
MFEEHEFPEVYAASSQISALGALMMAMDGKVTDLTIDEIYGVGVMLNDIGMRLREWNKKTGKEYDEEQKYAFAPSLRRALRQYLDIKKEVHGAILLFEGVNQDYYFCLFGDAYHVSNELGLELKFLDDLPKCVVPADLKDDCIGKMVDLGMKVAICGKVKERTADQESGGLPGDDEVKVGKIHLPPVSLTPNAGQETPMGH